MIDAKETSSTRPYLVRALYEWCTEHGFTPYIAVLVDETVRVPHEYVKNGEIVLNISFDATSSLKLGNDFIEFKGRFGGVARDIFVPIDRVMAIYARENGHGMAFPMLGKNNPADLVLKAATEKPALLTAVPPSQPSEDDEPPTPASPQRSSGRPSLKRIK